MPSSRHGGPRRHGTARHERGIVPCRLVPCLTVFVPVPCRAARLAMYTIIPGLDLSHGAEKFDTSTAESALASLCAVSVPNPCVEFAVKVLKDETPLPAEASEVLRGSSGK